MKLIAGACLWAAVLCLSAGRLHAEEFNAEKPPFKVVISPDQTIVKSGMMFLVRAQVIPQGDASLDMWGHSCSFEKHWVTDQGNVYIQSWTCAEDSLEHILLDGGETYEKNLILYITKNDASGPVTFRLGFKRLLEGGDEMEPVWSDPVTLRVNVPEGQEASVRSPADAIQDKTPSVEVVDTMPDEPKEPDDDTQ